MPLAALARQLLRLGHELTVISRDPIKVRKAFDGLPVRILSAPFFPGVIAPTAQQNSLADVIWFESGGHDGTIFGALFMAWRELLKTLRADLLIADAAPVALAAAQDLLPTISYDNGLHSTDAQGWQIFRDWERINQKASEERAGRLLMHLNSARAMAALPAADSLSSGFCAQRHLSRMPAQMDYAGPRADVRHIGQPLVPGIQPQWPETDHPQSLFVYLRAAYPLTERMLSALVRLPRATILCFHDGLSIEQQRAAAHLRYTQTMQDMAQVLPKVDAVVCHGGSLQALALQFGKPVLALPLHTEQYLYARQAERAGCGMLYLARGERPDFLPMIRQLLTQESLATKARAIAAEHSDRVPDPLQAAVDEVCAIIPMR